MKVANPNSIFIIFLIVIHLPLYAQVTLDGTLGPHVELPGPDYQIEAHLGQQHGGNLFHSFQDFNLQNVESATFSGSNSVNNIISRVTGNNSSHINGLIRSTIPNADMYFLNPYGIIFGPNAQLDVSGSFHASTADILRLQDGGKFNARQPSDSLLTVAPIEAFGFFTNTPSPITIQESKLFVSTGKTLSMIGGELRIGTATTIFNETEEEEIVFNTVLGAEFGQINLASIASPGEIIFTQKGLDLKGEGGQISINNTQLINISGEKTGDIFIRAGKLELKKSGIFLLGTENHQESGILEIIVTDLKLFNSTIGSVTASGKGPDVIIKTANHLSSESSLIGSLPADEQTNVSQGGNIEIESQQLTLSNDAIILSGTDVGEGGDVIIKVGNAMIQNSVIGSLSLGVEKNAGNAGDIDIKAQQMMLTDGAAILNGTFGLGDSGTTVIKVADALTISGVLEEEGDITQSGIINLPPPNLLDETEVLEGCPFCQSINKQESDLGKTGHLKIEARQLTLADGAEISSATYGFGDGGTIIINVSDTLTISGKYVGEEETLNSSLNSISPLPESNAGNAGNIQIQATKLNLVDGGEINTSTANAVGGNISINTPNVLHLRDGQITTSVNGGTGNGGDIIISQPQFVILENGQIKAQANEGKGGNIYIKSNKLIASPDSLVNASSRLGIDGEVNVDSPEINLDEFLIILPGNYLEIIPVLQPCGSQPTHKQNRFIVKHLNGSPLSPDDWKSSP